jgi:aminomethyltransferase
MTKLHYRTPAQQTPFHPRTAALCQTNEWLRWAGYTTVNCYTDVELEYFAIRNAATLYDVSPMIKYRIGGVDAEAYLNRLTVRDVAALKPGSVTYTAWCDDNGHVMDDGTLFRLKRTDFRLLCQERHLPWLLDAALGYEVSVEDITDDIAGVALQGPTSCMVLRRLGLSGIEVLEPFRFGEFAFAGGSLLVSRTGFTGDLGYELWVEPSMALALWDRLMASGRDLGIRPIGSKALNLARLEAGFIMANVDFVPAEHALRATRGRSPFELGLGWMVDFEKGHFNGRRALLRERENGQRYHLVGLEIEGNKPAHDALVYHRQKSEVGHVTSAMWSPTCKKNVALAMLRSPYGGKVRDDLWVEIYLNKEHKWDKVRARCAVVDRRHFRHPRRTATPPGNF